MTERGCKIWLAAGILLLLAPLTLLTALFFAVNYSAYPIPNSRPLQIAYDLGMLLQVAGILAAWRLAAQLLLAGRRSLRDVHGAWRVLLALGAIVGILGVAASVEHIMHPGTAANTVGFALFAPAAALAPFSITFRAGKVS